MKRVSSGIEGLDEILNGGYVKGRAYLVRGEPGCGKTILGLHFLIDGAKKGENVLFITLSEPEESIKRSAESLNLNVDGIEFLDLSPTSEYFASVETYDIFSPAEVEREPMSSAIVSKVEELNPARVFIDSMTQFRYLAPDAFQYRKQVLSLLRFLTERGATVLFTSESSSEAPDEDLQFLADGVIELAKNDRGFRLKVSKMRESDFVRGWHFMRICSGGIRVYPRRRPEKYERSFEMVKLSTGIKELDEMLKGGIEKGTVTIISGPSGVGKSSLAMRILYEGTLRGGVATYYCFDEDANTAIRRSESIGIPAGKMVEEGRLVIEQIEPLKYTAEEFTNLVLRDVEERNVSLVVIDSLSGYELSIEGEDVREHLHALCRLLTAKGVTVLIPLEVKEVSSIEITGREVSYIADNIILLRYYEFEGELRRCIGILKMRVSDFEKTLREFRITAEGIKIGEPLRDMRGLLTGIPERLER